MGQLRPMQNKVASYLGSKRDATDSPGPRTDCPLQPVDTLPQLPLSVLGGRLPPQGPFCRRHVAGADEAPELVHDVHAMVDLVLDAVVCVARPGSRAAAVVEEPQDLPQLLEADANGEQVGQGVLEILGEDENPLGRLPSGVEERHASRGDGEGIHEWRALGTELPVVVRVARRGDGLEGHGAEMGRELGGWESEVRASFGGNWASLGWEIRSIQQQ